MYYLIIFLSMLLSSLSYLYLKTRQVYTLRNISASWAVFPNQGSAYTSGSLEKLQGIIKILIIFLILSSLIMLHYCTKKQYFNHSFWLGSYTPVSVPHSLFKLTNMKVSKLMNMKVIKPTNMKHH